MLLNDFMKSKFFLISVLLLIIFQQGKTQGWERYYGNDYIDKGVDVRPTLDGGYIAIGNYDCNSPITNCNLFLLKVDSLGNEEWLYNYGGDGSSLFEVGESVIQAVDGGYIGVGGFVDLDIMESARGKIVKLNALGEEEWVKTIGDTINPLSFLDIQYATGNGYILVGETRGDSTLGADIFLMKIDDNGEEEWRKTIGYGIEVEKGRHIQSTFDGGYLIVGEGGRRGIILKIDEFGNEEWKLYQGTNDEWTRTNYSTQLDDGSYLVSMCYHTNGAQDYRVVKINEQGEEVWFLNYPEFAGFNGGAVIAIENNQAMLIHSDFGGINYRKINSDGEELWHHRELTISSMYTLLDQVTYRTNDGGYISTGGTNGIETDQIGLIKADSLGQVVVGIDNSATVINPKLFDLYPNPMRDELQIANKDFSTQGFDITIYDAQGREVIYQESNEMKRIINVKELSSGIYYYQIKTEDNIQNGKLIKVE
jgi:hypothetical protein